MLDSRPLTGAPRYPKLISFIGDTSKFFKIPDLGLSLTVVDAGKSTIVKALVSHGGLKLGNASAVRYQMPVPGST